MSKPLTEIETGRVGVIELTALLTIYTATDVFLSFPSRVAYEGQSMAWAIPLVSGVIVLAAFFIVHFCFTRFPGENILQVLTRLFGRVVTLPIALIFTVFFIAQTALVMREFTETVVTTVLPSTPTALIALSFLVVVVYYAHKGLEGLTRTAMIFSYIFVIGLGLLLLLPLSWFDSSLLLPLWGRGVKATLWFGTMNTSLFCNVLILSFMYPSIRNRNQFVYIGAVSILAAALIFSVVLVVFIGTFAVAPLGRVPFPLYQLARVIYVGRFIQRLESIFVFLWVAAAIIKMGFGLWLSAYLYAYAFHMPVYRPLLFPFALLLYVLSFLPPDFPTVLALSAHVFEPYGWTVSVAFPVFLALLAAFIDYLKHRRRPRSKEDSTSSIRKGTGRYRFRRRAIVR
ncbi:GerAB/ArcD/ProY family transporter [Sulfoacidibacillus thermotolerans]|uniref:Uncharacterized protein n=1 Tax=Sulfoacidibacillus thermotolerans TaxID=1765684 RepID=A0A2U3D9Y8_SULT2|nr:GerAB/ArcD/ProY family transporter [Sulfoacidibacillus thermotolerans]PWI58098.1 hypothetical protein BM613_05390 [Sulfoacidibacillus thermotolerans]